MGEKRQKWKNLITKQFSFLIIRSISVSSTNADFVLRMNDGINIFDQFVGISSENIFELDFINNKVIDPPLPISKSLWTTSVETAAEYCRIVWDLFPSGKLVGLLQMPDEKERESIF